MVCTLSIPTDARYFVLIHDAFSATDCHGIPVVFHFAADREGRTRASIDGPMLCNPARTGNRSLVHSTQYFEIGR